jgi:ribosome-binding factor A
LSIFSKEPTEKILELLEFHNKELRMKLAAEVKNQIRRVPEIKFYLDDTLEKAMKMDALIDSLSKPNKDSE